MVMSGAVAGALSGQERRDRDRRMLRGWNANLLRGGCQAESGDARRRDKLLHHSTNILILGCGGGNLATRLARLGKKLTIVDNNPISFVIAQKFFALPDGLPLMVSDFRNFILDDDLLYDGIAIDVGGPDFRFGDEFDVETCDAIRARLAPGGRIIMNVLVANDFDPVPDRIAARLAGDRLTAWIVDEQGVQDRNAIIACVPEKQLNARPALTEVMQNSLERWSIRRGRLRDRDLPLDARHR
jgi:SAM-dependent methyltransferase